MWFRTKKALLEYLGKNGNDNKLVDRLVNKGLVERVEGGYEYRGVECSENATVVELQGKNTLLEVKNSELSKQVEELTARVHELEEVCKDSLFGDNNGDTAKGDIEKELEELKVNYEYLHKKFQRLKKGYDLVIDLTYGYIKPHYRIEKSEYKEQLAESINEKLDDMFGRDE